MSVSSGFDKEGKDIYGLAHFCEHMLFLGSKKYPNPAHFIDFITRWGGKFNGYTDFETTAFFFKINSDKFENSLDIFAQIFIDPLFSKEYIIKEVNSVNSEYERNLQLDSKRKEMAFREIADKDSLFHRFSTGNMKTLLEYTQKNNIDLRERVVEYYKSQYRPDNMKLILMSDESVDVSKKKVEKYFNELVKPSTPYIPDVLSKWSKQYPFEFHNIGKLLLYKTINRHQDIDINFMIPDVFQSLPDNSSLFYKVLINYRGRGSLNDILRRNGYAAGMKSYLRKTYSGWSLFKIKGYITTKGMQNLDKVLKIIFTYLQSIRRKALNRTLYNYIKRSFDLSFFFNSRRKRMLRSLKLWCSTVWRYTKKFYFAQNKILPKYDKEKIQKFGEYLTLKNAIVIVGNRHFNLSKDDQLTKNYPTFVENFTQESILAREDPFYHTKFSEHKFTSGFVESVDSYVKVINNIQLYRRKKPLPKMASLIKFCIFALDKRTCLRNFRKDGAELTPKIIKSNAYSEFWYKRDRSFFVAKSNLYVRFIFNKDVNDPKYATVIRLLVYVYNHHLRNFFFEESLRRNSFSIKATPNGFSIKIYSYTENLRKTASSLLRLVKGIKLSEAEYGLVKDEMRAALQAQLNLVPALRAYVNFFKVILKDFVRFKALLETLKVMTLSEFTAMYQDLFKNFFIKVFVHGSIEKKKAEGIYNFIITEFKPESASIEKEVVDYQNAHSDLSGYYIFREKLLNNYNIIHAVLNFYQIGLDTIDNIFQANLVKAMCGYIYFTELRIKEQLGYTARAKIFSEGGVLYYMITVQGSRKTPDYMDLRIENLIGKMRKRIEETSQRKFERIKYLLARRIGRRDKNLKKRTIRLWNEIISKRGYFNIRNIAREHVVSLTKDDVLKFFDQMVTQKLSKLSVQEFAQHAEIPKTLPEIKGYQSELVTHVDYLRNKKKFLKRQ